MKKDLEKKIEQAQVLLSECLTELRDESKPSKNSKRTITPLERREKDASNYSGPKGGVRLLMERGYFKSKHSAQDVKTALEKEGYLYQAAVIQTALNRMVLKSGPLVNMKENGTKVYAERK